MKFNEKYAERPEHGHYTACLERMIEIKDICEKCFYYTTAVCVLMMIFTMLTVRLSVISWIPNMIGDGTSLASGFVQFIILFSLIGMSALAVGKYKFFNVILFVIYTLMALSCFYSGKAIDSITMLFGTGGAFFTFRSYSVMCDYRQLTNTEGFPHFNMRLAEQLENREYVAQYEDEYYHNDKQDMPEPEKTAPLEFDFHNSEMEAIETTSLNVTNEKNSQYNSSSEKFCFMSESPHKL